MSTGVLSLSRLSYLPELGCKEGVSLRVTRRQWAFGDTIDTVLSVCVQLTDSMPVYTCTIRWHRVFDPYLDRITPIRDYRGPGVLIIDQKTDTRATAIRIACRIGDLEVIRNCVPSIWPLSVEIGRYAEAVSPASPRQWAVVTSGVLVTATSGRSLYETCISRVRIR